MEISDLQDSEKEEFDAFEKTEWAIVDDTHYGNTPPNFVKISFTLLAKTERIVGQVQVEINQGVARVDSLLVGKEYQGKGIGGQLMRAAEIRAIELGAHKITLETGQDWSAKAFYEKLGYRTRAVLPNDVAHQDFVLMDKMLDEKS